MEHPDNNITRRRRRRRSAFKESKFKDLFGKRIREAVFLGKGGGAALDSCSAAPLAFGSSAVQVPGEHLNRVVIERPTEAASPLSRRI